jgi:hypothetical protein
MEEPRFLAATNFFPSAPASIQSPPCPPSFLVKNANLSDPT